MVQAKGISNANQESFVRNMLINRKHIKDPVYMKGIIDNTEEYSEDVEEFPEIGKKEETISESTYINENEELWIKNQENLENIIEQLLIQIEEKSEQINTLTSQVKMQQELIDTLRKNQKENSVQADKSEDGNKCNQEVQLQEKYKELKYKYDQLRIDILKKQNAERENQNKMLTLQNEVRNKTIEIQQLNEKNESLNKKVLLLEQVVNNTHFKELDRKFAQNQVETKDQVIQQLQEEIDALKKQIQRTQVRKKNQIEEQKAISKIQIYQNEKPSQDTKNEWSEQGFPQEIFVHQKFIQQFICQICIDVLNNPKFCKSCSTPFCNYCIRSLKQKYCPNCNSELNFFDQPFTNRLIFNLEVKCQYCKAEMQLDLYLNHKDRCNQKPVPCTYKRCNQIILQSLLEDHQKQCEFADYFCNVCCLMLQQNQIAKHNCISDMKSKMRQLIENQTLSTSNESKHETYEKEYWKEVFMKHSEQI